MTPRGQTALDSKFTNIQEAGRHWLGVGSRVSRRGKFTYRSFYSSPLPHIILKRTQENIIPNIWNTEGQFQ